MLRARQDVFHLLALLVPVSASLPSPAASLRAAVPLPPSAVSPPGTDRTQGARRCAPTGAEGSRSARPGGVKTSCGCDEPGARPGPRSGSGQLSALQPESGTCDPAAGHRGSGYHASVRVSGRGGTGSVRCPRLPADPRGAATGGLHVLVP